MLTPDDRATLTNASRIVRAQGDTPLADHFDALVGKLTEPFRPEGADALEAELRALGMLPPITPDFHCGPLTPDFNALSRWANQRQRPAAPPERPAETPQQTEPLPTSPNPQAGEYVDMGKALRWTTSPGHR